MFQRYLLAVFLSFKYRVCEAPNPLFNSDTWLRVVCVCELTRCPLYRAISVYRIISRWGKNSFNLNNGDEISLLHYVRYGKPPLRFCG